MVREMYRSDIERMLALAVHGGAGRRRGGDARRRGLQNALEAGRAVLLAGGRAVEAVVAAVTILEDDPLFNAGYGSVLNAQGEVECDAGMMDGRTLDVGAVAAVRDVKNPVRAARALLYDPLILLAKTDASRFARLHGVRMTAPEALIAPERRSPAITEGRGREGDTVGAVARDGAGDFAAATSTGGIAGKPPGRIGDSPLPGCGYYAENGVGACSTTGWGESIARLILARRTLELFAGNTPPVDAARLAIEMLGNRIDGGEGGLIVLNSSGQVGVHWNTESMSYAYWSQQSGLYVHY